jgi:hypothetical protein
MGIPDFQKFDKWENPLRAAKRMFGPQDINLKRKLDPLLQFSK